MSKTISNHPKVMECDHGPSTGLDEYKYDIFLKDGWVFEETGCRTLHCNTVAEFLSSKIIEAPDND